MARGAAALGRAAGVEDLEAVRLFVERQVAVAEDDRVGVGEAAAHAGEAALRRAGVVDHRYAGAVELDFEGLRQRRPQLRFVDVAVDRVDAGRR